jgi:hypothetical protein
MATSLLFAVSVESAIYHRVIQGSRHNLAYL